MNANTSGVLVLDSSVMVEMVIEGEHRAGVIALLKRYGSEDPPQLVSAAHGLLEATKALRRLVREGALLEYEARTGIGWLAGLQLNLDPPAPRLDRIWNLRDRMNAYDAAYAVTAETYGVPLITTDRLLLSACHSAQIEALHLDQLAE